MGVISGWKWVIDRGKMAATIDRKFNFLMMKIPVIFSCLLLIAFISFSQTDYQQYGNHNAHNFLYFFPDTALAQSVAGRLNKTITDTVTAEELANIKGSFDAGFNVSNLTGIGYLTGLDTFACYKNDVTVLPAEIGRLTSLTYLDLCKAFALQKIAPEIGNLKKLKMIRLCETEVKSVPSTIGNLPELETLWLFDNQLTTIPATIGKLKKLKDLDISSNKIIALPDEICDIVSLKKLLITHCGLKQLPGNIGHLKNLEHLNLFNNDLTELPRSISRLKHLNYLNVYDNYHLNKNYKSYLPKLLLSKSH